MLKDVRFLIALTSVVFVAGAMLGPLFQPWSDVHAETAKRVFEIRTYTAQEGKLDALNARFRDHTIPIFEKHGIKNVGYWVPQDAPLKQSTLIYILAHPSREAAAKNWEAFRNDPDWQKARAESEAKGPLVSRVESIFVEATDYSPMK
jgi:NIPSNAP protein